MAIKVTVAPGGNEALAEELRPLLSVLPHESLEVVIRSGKVVIYNQPRMTYNHSNDQWSVSSLKQP